MDAVLKNRIKTLEHLCYIIECLSLDYAGEAKYELSKLVESVREDTTRPHDELASQLAAALSELESGQTSGVGHLSSISRRLWRPVMEALNEGH